MIDDILVRRDPPPPDMVVVKELRSGGRCLLFFGNNVELEVPLKVFKVTEIGDRWPGMARRRTDRNV